MGLRQSFRKSKEYVRPSAATGVPSEMMARTSGSRQATRVPTAAPNEKPAKITGNPKLLFSHARAVRTSSCSPLSLVVRSLAQSRAAEVEAQHGKAERVQGLHGVEDDFVVHGSAVERVRMAHQRRNGLHQRRRRSAAPQAFRPGLRGTATVSLHGWLAIWFSLQMCRVLSYLLLSRETVSAGDCNGRRGRSRRKMHTPESPRGHARSG